MKKNGHLECSLMLATVNKIKDASWSILCLQQNKTDSQETTGHVKMKHSLNVLPAMSLSKIVIPFLFLVF